MLSDLIQALAGAIATGKEHPDDIQENQKRLEKAYADLKKVGVDHHTAQIMADILIKEMENTK